MSCTQSPPTPIFRLYLPWRTFLQSRDLNFQRISLHFHISFLLLQLVELLLEDLPHFSLLGNLLPHLAHLLFSPLTREESQEEEEEEDSEYCALFWLSCVPSQQCPFDKFSTNMISSVNISICNHAVTFLTQKLSTVMVHDCVETPNFRQLNWIPFVHKYVRSRVRVTLSSFAFWRLSRERRSFSAESCSQSCCSLLFFCCICSSSLLPRSLNSWKILESLINTLLLLLGLVIV